MKRSTKADIWIPLGIIVASVLFIAFLVGDWTCLLAPDPDPGGHGTVHRLNVVWEAINVCFDNRGEFPTTLADLSDVPEAMRALERLPKDALDKSADGFVIKDCWGREIIYKMTGGKGGGPMLYSVGPDGKTSTMAERKDNIYMSEHE